MGASSASSKSKALQIALFATGCSGIVAEFVLSTLATYLIGNATLQWTLIMSIMLFAMGVGSRYSRNLVVHLLDTFICIEFILSCFVAFSAILCFTLSAYVDAKEVLIYPYAFFIGFLIGLEIPMVTRLNSEYQELRTNISVVLEMDYFGSLIGGFGFAFVFLPFLGLAYTPVLLGSINFMVAAWLLLRYRGLVRFRRLLAGSAVFCLVVILLALVLARPMILYSEQKKYRDTIIYSKQTRYQKIVMTQWKTHLWLYIDGQEQFSTYDEERYHEPLVHPAMNLAAGREQVLILGGGDGLAAREVLKYKDVKSLILVDLDPVMTDLGRHHPRLRQINQDAFWDPRTKIVNQDAAAFLDGVLSLFHVIIIDLPDPGSMDLMHLYSDSFYRKVGQHLSRGGVMVTQATSPFFSKSAFLCIYKTIHAAGLGGIALHNPIPTLGEWGWVIGMNTEDLPIETAKKIAMGLTFEGIETRFINQDAMISMIHFGKGVFEPDVAGPIAINTESNPVLHQYYHQGSWGVY